MRVTATKIEIERPFLRVIAGEIARQAKGHLQFNDQLRCPAGAAFFSKIEDLVEHLLICDLYHAEIEGVTLAGPSTSHAVEKS